MNRDGRAAESLPEQSPAATRGGPSMPPPPPPPPPPAGFMSNTQSNSTISMGSRRIMAPYPLPPPPEYMSNRQNSGDGYMASQRRSAVPLSEYDIAMRGSRPLMHPQPPPLHQLPIRPCGVCSAILLCLKTSEEKLVNLVQLGNYAQMAMERPRCIHHVLLEDCLEAMLRSEESLFWDVEIYNDHQRLNSAIITFQKEPRGSLMCRLEMAAPRTQSGGASGGVIVEPEWLDISLLRQWKECCDRAHGARCVVSQTASHIFSAKPTWLIDTQNKCLVRALPEYSYVALSYVWGEQSQFRALRSNIEELQKHNSLSTSPIYNELANTIRHAIALAETLERYIWIDALCIVQDDYDHRWGELNNMASIYANASITIVAAQGTSADYGIRGLKGISPPRDPVQRIYPIMGKPVIMRQEYGSKIPLYWETRGWTFQESLCSTRRIIFSNRPVRWECPCGNWHEDGIMSTASPFEETPIVRRRAKLSLASRFPDMYYLGELLQSYNIRNLRYPEDVLAGFAGMASVLSFTFKGGFVSGLPLAFFDYALLWENNRPMRRRVAHNRVKEQTCLPSWSWAGWEGDIDRDIWNLGNDYVLESPNFLNRRFPTQVVPCVQWKFHEDALAAGTEIPCEWYAYKTSAQSNEAPLPNGWIRYAHLAGVAELRRIKDPPPFNEADLKYVYIHVSNPDSVFWYPIPLPEPDSEAQPMKAAPLLSCRTRRAFLRRGDYLGTSSLMISLLDEEGNWAGALRCNEYFPSSSYTIKQPESESNREIPSNSETDVDWETDSASDSELYPGMRREREIETDRLPALSRFELVEISKGYRAEAHGNALAHMEEWELEERPKTGELYEFYNILWIKWCADVAYRHGKGRVVKHIWERQNLEWIDLRLG